MTRIASRTLGEVAIDVKSFGLVVLLIAAFLFLVTLVAVWSLATGAGYIAPFLTLAMIALAVYGWLAEGIQTALVNLLGKFSRDHFVDCFKGEDFGKHLRVGFRLLNQQWTIFQISLSDLESMEWSTGQATDLAGKDMNDWHVTLWYDHHGKPHFTGGRKPGQNAYCLPNSGRQAPAESLGHALAEMVRSAGASLLLRADGYGYERSSLAP